MKRKLLLAVVLVGLGFGAAKSVAQHTGPALDGSGSCYGDPAGWICGTRFTSWATLHAEHRRLSERHPRRPAKFMLRQTKGPATTEPSAKSANRSVAGRGQASG